VAIAPSVPRRAGRFNSEMPPSQPCRRAGERRRLYEWALEPLYSLKGKVGGG
jgi:hypothetical protein